jgi:hypothetical protein
MRAIAPNIETVLTFMAKHGLTLDDLVNVGGEDLESLIPARRRKARRVSDCWELMAGQKVNFAKLEVALGSMPTSDPRTRRGDQNLKTPLKSLENSKSTKSNDFNDLAISAGLSGRKTELA